MDKIYEYLSGPVLWAAFIIFFVALIVRFTYHLALTGQQDGILSQSRKIRPVSISTLQQLVSNWGTTFQTQPVAAVASLLFHILLVGIPPLLLAHNTLWEEAFNIGLPSLNDSVADTLSLVFVLSALTLLATRVLSGQIRSRSTAWDYSMPVLAVAPFIAGFLASHQIGPYRLVLILHILFGEILIIAIPFSRPGARFSLLRKRYPAPRILKDKGLS